MVRKGVIVAAGYGTRFLPITRVVAKELLPIVDRPAIDLVVSEFIEAGIEEILLISSRKKKALEDWFDRDPELEAVFERQGAVEKAKKIVPPAVNTTIVRQITPGGTGHALLLAKEFAGDDPVVVAFPDDLFEDNATKNLIATYERTKACVLGVVDRSGTDVSRYGVVDPMERADGVIGVRSVVEKPAVGQEPSHLVSLGRYLYTPEFFAPLAKHYEAHTQGEYYPMAAMMEVAAAHHLVATVLSGQHYDTGTPLGFLKATVRVALKRPDVGPEFKAFIQEIAAEL